MRGHEKRSLVIDIEPNSKDKLLALTHKREETISKFKPSGFNLQKASLFPGFLLILQSLRGKVSNCKLGARLLLGFSTSAWKKMAKKRRLQPPSPSSKKLIELLPIRD